MRLFSSKVSVTAATGSRCEESNSSCDSSAAVEEVSHLLLKGATFYMIISLFCKLINGL